LYAIKYNLIFKSFEEKGKLFFIHKVRLSVGKKLSKIRVSNTSWFQSKAMKIVILSPYQIR